MPDIITIAAISVICEGVTVICKATPLHNKWLPVVSLVSGGILGVLGMMTMPEFPASDIISSVAIGMASAGIPVTTHQIYKQQVDHKGE